MNRAAAGLLLLCLTGSLAVAQEKKAALSPEDVATVNGIHAWTRLPREIDAWADSRASEVVRHGPSCIMPPTHELLVALSGTRTSKTPVDMEGVLIYLTSLVNVG